MDWELRLANAENELAKDEVLLQELAEADREAHQAWQEASKALDQQAQWVRGQRRVVLDLMEGADRQ